MSDTPNAAAQIASAAASSGGGGKGGGSSSGGGGSGKGSSGVGNGTLFGWDLTAVPRYLSEVDPQTLAIAGVALGATVLAGWLYLRRRHNNEMRAKVGLAPTYAAATNETGGGEGSGQDEPDAYQPVDSFLEESGTSEMNNSSSAGGGGSSGGGPTTPTLVIPPPSL